jgi:hypothetical protein
MTKHELFPALEAAKTERISVRLCPEAKSQLQDIARRKKISLSRLIQLLAAAAILADEDTVPAYFKAGRQPGV